ncbi:nitric oxide-associated protein 1-like [Odocoileus virginianus]|uniref:Nitric oxide-associated protein 1-like n=1 Tax=Odocoileus virginianus TaxID=9874 RepID=A0ABM4HFZ9_ODOVR
MMLPARTALRLPAGTHSHWSAPRRLGDAPPGYALPTPPPGPQRAWDVPFLVARRRLGVTQEGLTWRRVFCSPNASRDSEPELTLQDQLRELQQRREEEQRRRQRRGEERRLQKLRAGQQALPDRVPTLLSAGAPPARPAPSGEPGTVPGVVSAALRRPEPALVLYKVDLLDLPDALLLHLPALVGPKLLMVLGSMVALMSQDTPDYQQRLQEQLWDDYRRRAPAAPRLPKATTSQRGPATGRGGQCESSVQDPQGAQRRAAHQRQNLRAPALLALPRRRLPGWRHQR